MSNPNLTPTPDQMQPPTPPAAPPTTPAQAPQGVGSAIQGASGAGTPPVATPNAAPTAPTAQSNAAAGQPQPAQTPTDAHVSAYRKILQGFAAPSGSYVDPSGNVKPTNVSLGRTVLASVIAGMMSPTQYRHTE